MGTVRRINVSLVSPPLAAAVPAFLAEVANPNTARSYGIALGALADHLETATTVAALNEEATVERIGAWFVDRWGHAANATVNARLDALRSASAWWRTQGWLTGDPTRRIRRRRRAPDRTRA